MSSGDGFFTDGAAYERLMGRWSRKVGEVFLDWIAIPPARRWLDVGCGTGVFTQEIVARCAPAEVVAIDPSGDQLAYARARPGLDLAEFSVADAQALPFAEGRFDVAVMALVIHFVPQPPLAVAEMARVVRPGGSVVSYVWDYSVAGSPTAPLNAAMKALGMETAGPPSPQATSVPALRELWQAAGLDDIETSVIRIPVVFDDFDAFWQSMSAPVGPTGKAIARMPEETVEQLRARLKAGAATDAAGRVRYEACANAVRGRVRP